tara:strand:- start:6 stop:164 length:159 start_codon:yes stop_codon:yes gene_type:complete
LKEKDVEVVISTMVLCSDVVIIEYDGRTPGLSNTPLYMKHDPTWIEKYTLQS